MLQLQKPHFLERASVVMVDHESGLTRAPTDNLEHHSLEFQGHPRQEVSCTCIPLALGVRFYMHRD